MNTNTILDRDPAHPGEQYIRDWRVLGPFSFRDTAFATTEASPAVLDWQAAPDEQGLDPANDAQGWRDLRRVSCYCNELADGLEAFEPGYVSKYEVFKKSHRTVLYFGALIEAGDDLDGLLGIATSTYHRVWWNGELVPCPDGESLGGFDPDGDLLPVRIHKGTNHLVIKSAQHLQDLWYVCAKLKGADGQPLTICSTQAAAVEDSDLRITMDPSEPIRPLWIRDMAAPLAYRWSDGSVLIACHHQAAYERYLSTDGLGDWQACCPPAIGYNTIELADGTRFTIGGGGDFTGGGGHALGDGRFMTWAHRSAPHTLTFSGPHEVLIHCPGARDWGADDQGRRMPSGFSVHAMVPLSDGRILAACYGYWEGDTDYDEDAIRSRLPVEELGMTKFRAFALESTDQGRSFQYCGMIADQMDCGTEGFCEPSVVELSSGELLAVLRNGAKSRFLWQTRSRDGGRTWDEPQRLPFRGVFPALQMLDNGVLVCGYVRPFLMLAVDPTGTGNGWSYNVLIATSSIAGGTQGGMTSIAEGRPNTVYYPLYQERPLQTAVKGLTKRVFLCNQKIRINELKIIDRSRAIAAAPAPSRPGRRSLTRNVFRRRLPGGITGRSTAEESPMPTTRVTRTGSGLSLLQNRILLGVFAALFGGLTGNAARADVAMVKEGMAEAVIAVADSPSEAETLAAERLQYYVEKISGVKLAVVEESAAASGNKIYVGRTTASSALLAELAAMPAPAEASLVVAKGDEVHIVGIDDVGTLHATYFLLEGLGCRWYMPGEWGTVMPESKNLIIPTGRTYRAPDFTWRTGREVVSTRIDPDPTWAVYEWGRGNHLWGPARAFSGHSYSQLVSRSLLARHPEYFALINGKRNGAQLCTTNAQVRKIALEKVRATLAKSPPHPQELSTSNALVTISPNDGFDFCECDACKKLIPKDGGTADRIVDLANYIGRNICDEYPDVKVIFLADYHSADAPTIVKPESNLCAWLVQWSQDQFHGVSPETRMGRALQHWRRFGIPLKVYTYYGSYGSFTFWPQVHAIRKDIPYYKKHGVVGLYSNTTPNWGCQALNLIVYPRLLWDIDTDVDGYIDEFCSLFYGPASRPMRAYYDLLETTAANGPPMFHHHEAIADLFAPHLDRLAAYIKSARDAVRDAASIYQQRVGFSAAGFKLAQLYINSDQEMRHKYLNENDPNVRKKIRQGAINRYRQLLHLIQSPEYRDRLVRNSVFEPEIEEELEYLEQGTTFGIGDFSYWEYCVKGGRTAMNAEVKKGWRDGPWGLNLPASTTGVLAYRFQTCDEGVFEEARIKFLVFACDGKLSNEISVSTDNGRNYRLLFRNRNMDNVTASEPDETEQDITALVAGRSEFLVRLTAHNGSDIERCSLIRIVFNGKVKPRGNGPAGHSGPG